MQPDKDCHSIVAIATILT